MFRGAPQSGYISVFHSSGKNPLEIWRSQKQNGHIKRIMDEDIKSIVLEIMGSNVFTNFITAPRDSKMSFGVKLPFLVLLIKNLHKHFTFDVKILDDQQIERRFRITNFQLKTSIKPLCTVMPMGMSPGWNHINFNLADFTRRAYGTNYLETVRLLIYANVRILRVYFTDRLYSEDELPKEFKIISRPGQSKQDENIAIASSSSPTKSSCSGITTATSSYRSSIV